MSQSLASILVHVIFSTKQRKPIILHEIKKELHSYMVGIALAHKSLVHEIGGIEDHVHLLISLPRTMTISKFIEEIKKGSSKWIKTKGEVYINFSWQNGYGAFSISQSSYEKVRYYIQNQEEHHRNISFQDEFRAFLKKYQIDYSEEYLWD